MKSLQRFYAIIFAVLALSSVQQIQGQTMTFDSGASEPGFSFSGWGWYNAGGDGRAYVDQPNVNWVATITRDVNCFDFISFQKIPFGGGSGIWKVWDNTGREHLFQIFGGGTETLNWQSCKWIKFKLEDPGTGIPNNAWDFDNLVYVIRTPVSALAPSLSLSPTMTCVGDTAVLSASGTLNDNNYWKVYTGGCGVTTLDSMPFGASQTLEVHPFQTTTYYVRGEGVCAPPGPCTSITLTVDNVPPAITCPEPMTISTDPGLCGATINYTPPVGTDNCPNSSTFLTGGTASGAFQGTGVELVQYQVTDAAGNTATCSFQVNVIDMEPPVAVCDDVTVALDATGNATLDPLSLWSGSSDNCGISSMTAVPSTVSCADIGTLVVALSISDLNGNTASCNANVTVEDPLNSCCVFQSIPLNEGWNMVSSYILPDALDFLDVLAPIEADIVIAKDEAGQVAIPSGPLNQIGDWSVTEGYQIRASASTTLVLGCTQVVPEATPIPLTTGWNITSYLRNGPMDAAAALNSITGSIIIVKDVDGKVYVPSIPFNNIGDLVPGQGYQIKLSEDATLTYPAND